MRRSLTLTCVLAFAACAAPAAITQTARITSTAIHFNGPTFAEARAHYANELSHRAGDPDDALAVTWGLLGDFRNFDLSCDDWITLDYQHPQPDSFLDPQELSFRVGFQTGGPERGTVYLSYETPASTAPLSAGRSFLRSGAADVLGTPHHALFFAGGGSSGVDDAGTFTTQVTLPGEWVYNQRVAGGALVSWNYGDYDAVDHWVYNAGTGHTTLTLHAPYYRGVNPDIRITLIGSPVPAPGAALVLAAAVAPLTRRSRRTD